MMGLAFTGCTSDTSVGDNPDLSRVHGIITTLLMKTTAIMVGLFIK